MTLFFMHLTKTAGGSVKELVKKVGNGVQMHYADEPGFRPDFQYKTEPEILYGHFPWGVHKRVGLPAHYACFVRDPVKRTVSHFYHLQTADKGPVGDKAREFESIQEYIQASRRWEFDNFMCRLISGVHNKGPFGSVDDIVLDRAMHNLRNFAFVGLFEDLPDSLERLQKIIPGIGTKLPVVNKGQTSKKPSASDLEYCEKVNRYDQVLYAEAVRLARQPEELFPA